jgi:hypothetical protein
MLVVFPRLISQLKIPSFIKKMKKLPIKIKFLFKRIYRLINFRRTSHYVWKDLIQYHKESGWKFGQFEADKLIKCTFEIEENSFLNFNYVVNNHSLIFRSIILQNFDEERTNDLLVLASHFNALLNFGVVKVSVKYNYVEFLYTRDLLTYSLFSGEINSDTDTHFAIAKDCLWSFTKLIETGDDPVFIFSELMRNKENNDSTNN